MERTDAILQITFNTDGGTMIFGSEAHEQIPQAFLDIGQDPDNRAVIMTGTGDAFIEEVETATLEGIPGEGSRLPDWTKMSPRTWDRTFTNAKAMLLNLLDIEVPIIAAVNGPVNIHADVPALSDIVLAAEHTYFQDGPHYINGLVPPRRLPYHLAAFAGRNRGRYFLLTGQRLSAREAHDLGVGNEVLPADEVLPRAWELAEQILRQPPLTVHYTRVVMTLELKELFQRHLSHGLALTGLAANDFWPN